jgi:uncharacterized SAM-binding protein YcdF (DUF218 family)
MLDKAITLRVSRNYLLWQLFGPVTWPFWLLLLAWATPNKRMPRAVFFLKITATLWLGLMLLSPLGALLIYPLENFAPRNQLPNRVNAIIVLTGGEALRLSAATGQPQISSAGNRLVAARRLAQAHPQAQVIVVGGLRDPSGLQDIDVARAILLQTGLEPQRLTLIGNTSDTCTNAQGLQAYLNKTALRQAAGLVLVTSAFHMPRTLLCFEKQGIEVLAYPVDYYANPNGVTINIANPVENLKRVDFALHEWAGLVYYRLTGRTHKLWPNPNTAVEQNKQAPLTVPPKKP